jgi:hypothetical protein
MARKRWFLAEADFLVVTLRHIRPAAGPMSAETRQGAAT